MIIHHRNPPSNSDEDDTGGASKGSSDTQPPMEGTTDNTGGNDLATLPNEDTTYKELVEGQPAPTYIIVDPSAPTLSGVEPTSAAGKTTKVDIPEIAGDGGGREILFLGDFPKDGSTLDQLMDCATKLKNQGLSPQQAAEQCGASHSLPGGADSIGGDPVGDVLKAGGSDSNAFDCSSSIGIVNPGIVNPYAEDEEIVYEDEEGSEIEAGVIEPLQRIDPMLMPDSATAEEYNQLINNDPNRQALNQFYKEMPDFLNRLKQILTGGLGKASDPAGKAIENLPKAFDEANTYFKDPANNNPPGFEPRDPTDIKKTDPNADSTPLCIQGLEF